MSTTPPTNRVTSTGDAADHANRDSTGGGYAYSIELNDEPLYPNVTLLEKLRVDFGIVAPALDDLPEDENGLDVELIFRNFRNAIRDIPKWDVLDTTSIGLFSFNKFLMWKDLQEKSETLKQNRLVQHLIDLPEDAFDAEPFPASQELDDRLKPDDLLCTRDADSSQLTAVCAAADERSFVLEGPPGTGKSQTIANIIADALARGRRVLFVAEKKAALSVVRKRLDRMAWAPSASNCTLRKPLKSRSSRRSRKALKPHTTPSLRIGTRCVPSWGRHAISSTPTSAPCMSFVAPAKASTA